MPAEAPPPVQETSTQLPGQLPQPKHIAPEDDPNLKLQNMIRKNREEEPTETPEKKADKPPEDKKPVNLDKLSGAIGKALGFKEDKKKDEDEDEDEETVKVPEDKKADKAPKDDKKPDPEPKTIVRRKKEIPNQPAAPVVDPVQIAQATATAVAKAISGDKKPEARPEDGLKESDRREYDVAKYLAQANPNKFKDAPRIILSNIAKAESYAQRWEAANPGKIFDPEDEEHDAFYDSVRPPWSETEFHDAVESRAKSETKEELSKEFKTQISELERQSARIELSPVVDRTHVAAAALLAQQVSEDVHKAIVEQGFDKFADNDPITADALANEAGQLKPLIETAIQLDDPKGRFQYDPKNKLHTEWNGLILELEHSMAGTEDKHGRNFATRQQYASMTDRQRQNHWYLTTEHLIEALVGDAADRIKKGVEKEKDRAKKVALSLGYIPKEEKAPGDEKAKPPKTEKKEKDKEPEQSSRKPESPSVGAGAKTDDTPEGTPSAVKKFLDTTAGILFNR